MKTKQKFKRGQKVHVNVTSQCKAHFHTNMDAIVKSSYAEEYGGGAEERKSYTLLLLPVGEKPFSCSWYEDDELELLDASTKAGRVLLEKYWKN